MLSLLRPRQLIKGVALLVLVALLAIVGVRVYDALTGPPLAPWHTYIPDELTAQEIDRIGWAEYRAVEVAVFASVRDNVTNKLKAGIAPPENRYYAASSLNPGGVREDWNCSYIFEPQGPP